MESQRVRHKWSDLAHTGQPHSSRSWIAILCWSWVNLSLLEKYQFVLGQHIWVPRKTVQDYRGGSTVIRDAGSPIFLPHHPSIWLSFSRSSHGPGELVVFYEIRATSQKKQGQREYTFQVTQLLWSSLQGRPHNISWIDHMATSQNSVC